MKKLLILFLLGFTISSSFAQNKIIDSLNHKLHVADNDTIRLVFSYRLSWAWLNINSDSSILNAEQYLKLSQKLNYRINEADALSLRAYNNIYLGNYPRALETLFKALKTLDKNNQNKKILPAKYLDMMQVPVNLQPLHNYSLWIEGNVHSDFAFLYWINQKDDEYPHIQRVSQIAKEIRTNDLLAFSYLWKANHSFDKPDTAIYYAFRARELYLKTNYHWMAGACDEMAALAYHIKGDRESELKYLRLGLHENIINYSIRNSGWSYTKLSDYFSEKGYLDSVVCYAHKALSVSVKGNYPDIELKAVEQLANAFKSVNLRDSSYKYLQLWVDVRNKSLNSETARQFENVQNNQQMQQRELLAAKVRYQNRLKLSAYLF